MGKPLMVILTRPGCGACQNLKQSVNFGSKVKERLSKFVVVHGEGNEGLEAWATKGETYFPQTYFFPPGENKPLPIQSQNDKAKYFLHDDETMAWGMDTAVMAVQTGARGEGDDPRTGAQVSSEL